MKPFRQRVIDQKREYTVFNTKGRYRRGETMKEEGVNKTPKIVEMPEKEKDKFDKEGDRIFAIIDEKHKQIQELYNEIESLTTAYIDLVGEERAKRNKK